MIEKGPTRGEDNRKFKEKASKLFGKSRTNPFIDKRFGRDWTEKHEIVVRTFGYQALKHWEDEFPAIKKGIVEGLNASENQLRVNNGELLVEEIDYYSGNDNSLLFLKTKSERRNRNYFILFSNKKGGDEAYIIDRTQGSEKARINFYPDGVRLKNPEYRTSYVRKGASPSEGTSKFWLELTQDLKTIDRENILPTVSENWSNYELGI